MRLRTYTMPRRQPREKRTGKSRGERCAAPKSSAEEGMAAQVGMNLVREVRRKPRNTVSSRRGARTPEKRGRSRGRRRTRIREEGRRVRGRETRR